MIEPWSQTAEGPGSLLCPGGKQRSGSLQHNRVDLIDVRSSARISRRSVCVCSALTTEPMYFFTRSGYSFTASLMEQKMTPACTPAAVQRAVRSSACMHLHLADKLCLLPRIYTICLS